MKIMIIDDEEAIRELFTQFMEMRGYKDVLAVATGKDAIAQAAAQKPDVAFLDVQLADNITGIEVLKNIRELSPTTKVIMMSSYQDEYGALTQSMGAFDFLRKPFTSESLKNMIKKVAG